MPSLLEALLANTETVEKVRPLAGSDPQRAEQAYGAAIGAMLRGMEQKAETKEGAESLWDLLRKHAEQGDIPKEAPSSQGGVQVRDMDPSAVNDIFKTIFGKEAPQVEGGFGKVITLDPETTRKVFAKVLPTLLGTIFGATKQAPQPDPEALPNILGGARKELEERSPKSANVFGAILDKDHDGDVDLQDLLEIFAGK